jgi:hypothetical protein
MLPLGEILIARGWLSEQQLSEAFTRQAAVGGRLGTCLLEIGAIQEVLLIKVLAEQLGVPFADAADLRNIPKDVRDLLPSSLAVQHSAVPFRASTTSVDIAMLDVKNLTLQDELSFVIGSKLRVHIANEARIFEALEKYYGKGCPARFSPLLKRLNRDNTQDPRLQRKPAPPAKTDTEPIPSLASPPAATTTTGRFSYRSTPIQSQPKPEALVRQTIAVTHRELDKMGSAPPTEDENGPIPQAIDVYFQDHHSGDGSQSLPEPDLDVIEARLEEARTSDAVGQALLEFFSYQFARVLLFKVRSGKVSGWLCSGKGLSQDRFKAYTVDLKEPSIFLNLSQGGDFFLGKLPPMPPHTRLAECWNEEEAHECAVFPIRLGNRLVSLVYGDRDCLGLDGIDVAMLRRLVSKASIALKVCIMQKKLRKA